MELSNIKEARSVLDLYHNIEILEDIFTFKNNYYMKISIEIEESHTPYVPLITNWYVKFNKNSIDFLPA